MSNSFFTAHDAVGERPSHPDLHMGQKVIELGGDGSLFQIAAFERVGRGEYVARCLKLFTDEVVSLPVSRLKPFDAVTIH
jgi:hypothetical protein